MTRLPSPTVSDETLRRNIYVSAGLHFAALLFLFFGLPVFIKPLPTPSTPIPFEIVDIADITNTRLKDQPQEQPKPPAPPPKPEEHKAEAPPTPPTPPQPQQKPEPPKPQEVKPAEKAEVMPLPTKKPEPPKPVAKPQPQLDMLAKVLKDVSKIKPATPAKSPDAKATTQDQAQPKSAAPSLSDRLTISEEDALRRQIEQHWNVPIGARDVENMVVEVRIDVNSDRTVQNVEVVDKSRMVTDSYFRAMAESVIRAIYASSPLQVPEGKYEQWKVITSDFSAKDML